MSTETTDAFRGASYEIAEAIAPTWERRDADIEDVATPVREWMVRELRPGSGDALFEHAAGLGDTGFEAAAMVATRSAKEDRDDEHRHDDQLCRRCD
jgi:hypothetical protein